MNESCAADRLSCACETNKQGRWEQSAADDSKWKRSDMGTSVSRESAGLTTKPCALIHQRLRLPSPLSISKWHTSQAASEHDSVQALVSHLLFFLLLYVSPMQCIMPAFGFIFSKISFFLLFCLLIPFFCDNFLCSKHRRQSSCNKPSLSLLIIRALGWMIAQKASPSLRDSRPRFTM